MPSPLSQAETRRLLYRRVVLVPSTRLRQFYATIQARPDLGALVEEIHHHGSLSCQQLVQHLHLLPNLRGLEGTYISRLDPLSLSGAHSFRPRLDYLATDVTDPLFGTQLLTLGRWFDLTSLRRLEIVGAFDGIAAGLVLFDVPPTVQELAFRNLPMCHLERLLNRTAPFIPRLSVLELVFQRRLSDGSAQAWSAPLPFDRFKSLRRLTLSADDISPLLDAGSASLQTLVVGYPGIEFAQDELGADLHSKVHAHVSALCRTVAAHPARFPALRRVSLLPPAWGFSFATAIERRHLGSGVVEVARELQAVGLLLVDEDGTAWRSEWDDDDDDERALAARPS